MNAASLHMSRLHRHVAGQINLGRPLVGADIVSLSIFDLTEDATFVRTPAGTTVPLCEGAP